MTIVTTLAEASPLKPEVRQMSVPGTAAVTRAGT
jgi:hypothetical protein